MNNQPDNQVVGGDSAIPQQFSVGAALREAREHLGMSVADVSNRIKFAPRQIEALEADDFAHLPEAAFVRGFVRSYARLLEMDATPLLAGLPQTHVQATAAPEKKSVEVPFPSVLTSRLSNIAWLAGGLAVALVLIIFSRMHDSSTEIVQPVAQTNVETLELPAAAIAAASAPVAEVLPAEAPAPSAVPPKPAVKAPVATAPAQPQIASAQPQTALAQAQTALAQQTKDKLNKEQLSKEQAALERAAKKQAAKELAAKELAAREQAAQERAAKKQAAKELAAKERAAKELAAKEQAAKELAAKEQAAKERAAKKQAAKELAAKERAAKELAAKEQAAKEQAAKEQAAKERAAKKQAAKELAAQERAAKELAAKEKAAKELAAKEQAAKERAAKKQAAKELAAREQESRKQAAKVAKPSNGISEQASLRLVFDQDSWVDVKDANGKLLLSKMNHAGSLVRVSGTAPLSLVIKHPNGVHLFYKGKEVGLGPHISGEVANVSLE